MGYKQQHWNDYDETKTETQNIENGAVVTSERMNYIENGLGSVATLLDLKVNTSTFEKAANRLEEKIVNAQSGYLGTFINENALKGKYPKGAAGFAIVKKAVGNIDYYYEWLNENWTRQRPVTENQFIDFFEEMKVGSDGVVYDTPKQSMDMTHAKIDNSIDIAKRNLLDFTNEIDPRWDLGLIDEKTGEVNNAAWSRKMHSRRIELKEKEFLNIKLSNFQNGLVFLYNNDKFVKNLGFFTGEGAVLQDGTFTHLIILVGYRDDTEMKSPEELKASAKLVTVELTNKQTVTKKLNSIINIEGLTPLKIDYGVVRDLPGNYDEIVNTAGRPYSIYNSVYADVYEGEVFLISGVGGVNPRLWAFLDKDNRLISLSKSSLTVKDKFIIAPANAKKIILNDSSNSISYRVNVQLFKKDIMLEQESFSVGVMDIGKFKIGDIVNPKLTYNLNYSSLVVPVKANTTFYMSGSGGENPRHISYLDKDYRLIYMSDKWYASRHEHGLRTVPENAKYLIINSNLTAPYKPKFVINNTTEIVTKENELSKTNLQRHLPSTVIMSDFINGIDFKEKLENPLFNFEMPEDHMAHCSSFRIVDDIVYASFYINKIQHEEKPQEHTAVLRFRKLDGSDELKSVTVCDIGDEMFDGKVDAIYDTVVLTELNDIRIVFTARIKGQYYLLYKIYDPVLDSLTEAFHCQFSYGDTTEEFSTNGMKKVLKLNNIYFPYFDSDVSYMQKLTPRVENGETWWYLGLGVLQFCFIAKTKDLVNYHYVSQPTFNHTSMYEPSVYVKDDEVFYLVRQAVLGVNPYAFLSKYNLITGEWTTPALIQDCQSRSDFFEYDNELYAIHAPFNRNHLTITKINKENLEMSFPIQTAYVNNMFYPFVQVHNNELYLSVTQNRDDIKLVKFDLFSQSEGTAKVIDIFQKLMVGE